MSFIIMWGKNGGYISNYNKSIIIPDDKKLFVLFKMVSII